MRTDAELLEFAVRNAGHNSHSQLPRWSHVGSLTGLGSTSSILLCERFGVDPDEQVPEDHPCNVCELAVEHSDPFPLFNAK